MKNKKVISVIAIILAVLMLVSLVAMAVPSAAYADDTAEETEQEEQEDLEALREKKAQITSQVKECRERLKALQEQEANVLEQKAALEEQNRLAKEKLEIIAAEIEDYNKLIANKAKEVDAAKNKEADQLERYRTRIRAMEENGGYNILALVLKADNFAELITAMDDMGEIMESDKLLQKQYEEAREETEAIKAQYEAEKAEYEKKQEELKAEQNELEEQIKEAEELLEELAEEIEKAIQEYKAAEAAEQSAAATIANAIAQNNAKKAAAQTVATQNAEAAAAQVQAMTEANAQAEAAGQEAPYTQEEIQETIQQAAVEEVTQTVQTESYGSSGLMWPVPCSTRVTSRFGNRADPFTGATAYHSGIDIDGFGNDGAPVVAAASGTVITASYDSAYGNYVIIDHGDMSTVYAHLSGIAVSAGSQVSQGQTVGYLGATGRATGTHLHFEVYVGDSRVDPASYFSGLTYYNC